MGNVTISITIQEINKVRVMAHDDPMPSLQLLGVYKQWIGTLELIAGLDYWTDL